MNHSRIPSALALIALGLVTHCGSPRSINVEDYSQSCTADADCVAVAAGDICTSCCPNVSIHKSDLATYQSDVEDVACDYGDYYVPCLARDCGVEAFCNKSRCDVRRAEQYDR